jgi:hypothetical protein
MHRKPTLCCGFRQCNTTQYSTTNRHTEHTTQHNIVQHHKLAHRAHNTVQHHKPAYRAHKFTLPEAVHSCLSFHVTHEDKDAPWGWHIGAETCRSRIIINTLTKPSAQCWFSMHNIWCLINIVNSHSVKVLPPAVGRYGNVNQWAVLLTNYHYGHQITNNEMGGACGKCGGKGHLRTEFWSGNLNERVRLEDLDIDGRIITK